jgi:hypothetical protein
MIARIKTFLSSKVGFISKTHSVANYLYNDLKSSKVNLGQIQAMLNNQRVSINNLSDVEFQVFSQWGDDGIIQYLINRLDIPNKTFIEFGVEDYRESNTRFLLINNNWTGLVIDGSEDNINVIKNDIISWACELHAVNSFITAENINQLIQKVNFHHEVGILSVDIDGNDYWVWKAIDCISPIMVIAEYNSLFGINTSWTLPYDPAFARKRDHTIIYYGASLRALCMLAAEKGYVFVGCNSKGNNAYFIREDKMNDSIKAKTPEEGFVVTKIREAQVGGQYVSGEERIKLIKGLNIFDLQQNKIIPIDPSIVRYK